MLVWMIGLSFIMIQSIFHPFKSVSLSGEEWVPEIDSLSIATFENLSFQKQVDHWTSKKFGFREVMVRFYNQVLYWTFGECTYFIEIGDDCFLFEKDYRDSACGENLIPKVEIELKLDSLEILSDFLNERGKKLIVVVAPNKYRYYPDKVSLNCDDRETNYSHFTAGFNHSKYAVFDCIELFPKMTSQYPLVPKSGTHWSLYGAFRTAQLIQDSLVKWEFAGAPLEISAIEIDDTPRQTDKDLHDLLNIMTYAPKEELAYPYTDYHNPKKPRMLIVGDSFYESFYRLNIHSDVYDPESKLLYYNQKMFGRGRNISREFNADDLFVELYNTDVVMIVSNEGALKNFGWGFLTDAIQLLHE